MTDTGEFATVYNMRVAEYHTYFVGCAESWGFSVWAHNVYQGSDVHEEVGRLPRNLNVSDDIANRAAAAMQAGRADEAWAILQEANGIGTRYAQRVVDALEARRAQVNVRIMSPVETPARTPHEVAGEAAQGFPNFHCRQCADAVETALQSQGMNGTRVVLDTHRRDGLSARITFRGAGVPEDLISTTGVHEAILLGGTEFPGTHGTMYDNHNPNGIPDHGADGSN